MSGPIERLRAQVKRFGLDTGDDHTRVINKGDGKAEVTSDLAEPILVDAEGCAEALEGLPDDAPVAEDEGWRQDRPSVWGTVFDHEA